MTFQNYLFQLFPKGIRASDSYKNAQGKGLLERYVGIIENELDTEFIGFVDNFLSNIYAISGNNVKFIPSLFNHLGNPATPTTLTDAQKILVLKYLTRIYQLKGTAISFELYFSLFGYQVKIMEDTPLKPITYDSLTPDGIFIRYDDSFTYDQDCEQCTYYDIWINTTPNPTLIDRFTPVICFLQPINAKFRSFKETIFLQDNYQFEEGLPDDLTPTIS